MFNSLSTRAVLFREDGRLGGTSEEACLRITSTQRPLHLSTSRSHSAPMRLNRLDIPGRWNASDRLFLLEKSPVEAPESHSSRRCSCVPSGGGPQQAFRGQWVKNSFFTSSSATKLNGELRIVLLDQPQAFVILSLGADSMDFFTSSMSRVQSTSRLSSLAPFPVTR